MYFVKRRIARVIQSHHILLIYSQTLEALVNAFFQNPSVVERIISKVKHPAFGLLRTNCVSHAHGKGYDQRANHRLFHHNKFNTLANLAK